MGFWQRLGKLILGLFVASIGIMMTIHAEIGYSPWDVFHVGLAETIGMSLGTIAILVGAVVVTGAYLLGETLGIGSILNMLLIGLFMDFIVWTGLLPKMHSFLPGLGMLVLGMAVLSLGMFLYMSSGFGAGPRDSLMVAAHRKTNLPVGVCRAAIEVVVTILGYLLGGLVGVGTVITALLSGPMVQLVFALFRFDPRAITHETLPETYRRFRPYKPESPTA